MSQAPAMPLFWGDYWSKTRRLSPAQHHAYLFLLGATWMNNCCPFPDDAAAIAGEIGISIPAWRRVRPSLVRFFDLSDGTWRNHKLEEVWAGVMRRIEKNRKNGELGGRPAKTEQPEIQEENQRPEKPNGYVLQNPEKPNQNQNYKKENSVGSSEPTAAEPASGGQVPGSLVVVAGTEHKSEPPDPKKAIYTLAKTVLGPKAGGMVTKLIAVHDGDCAAAFYTMQQAEAAAFPREYLGKILSREENAPTDWDNHPAYRGMRL